MNSTIERILDKLKHYPDAKFTNTDDSITVNPKDETGFPVSINVGHQEILVLSDFWHEHFDKSEEREALNCFSLMLSDACRFRIEYKGNKPKRWAIETFENGEWKSDSTTGLFNFRFWGATRIEYRQNDLIKTKR